MKISVKEAAQMINASQEYVRMGLQLGRLPIGSAVKMSSRWTYNISPKLLAEYIGERRKDGDFS